MRRLILILISFIAFCAIIQAQNINFLNSLKSDKQKADTLYVLSMIQFRNQRFDSAQYFLKDALKFANKTGDNHLMAHLYNSLGNTFIQDKKPSEGLVYLKKVLPYLSDNSTPELTFRYYIFTGMAFEDLNQVDSSMYYYHQAELVNNATIPYNNQWVFTKIGLLLQRAENYSEAEKYFLRAYNLTKPKGIRIDHGMLLYHLSNLYFDWKRPEKYADVLEERQAFLRSGKKDYTSDPMHDMLFSGWQTRPFIERISFLENVKKELLKNNSRENAALANIYLSEFYEKEHLPEVALGYVLENRKLLAENTDLSKTMANEKIIYRLLKTTGKIEKALIQADLLFSLKDSMIKVQQRETLADLEKKYETEKKAKDIILLNAEKEINAYRLHNEMNLSQTLLSENILKDSEVNKQIDFNKLLAQENVLRETQLANEKDLKAALIRENNLRKNQLAKEKRAKWLLISGGLLLLIFGLIIFYLYRKQRSKNLLIQKQADDLQMLMREIHHRVKNNLQVISSLLDLQSVTIKDKHASEAIKESRNRVYSMALIHQNLYKDSNIIGIDMNDYINQLVQSLFQSYHSGENKIELETDIDPLVLDVDIVIPIGLLLNELISNSLKYAFNNTSSGILHIAFKKLDNEMLLTVRDNGAGFPKDMNVFKTTSFGYKLVKAFAQKLKGRLEVFNDNGACIVLHIKKMNLA